MDIPKVKQLLNHLEHRGQVLRQLHGGLYDSQEIAEEIGKSRSSVDRDLRLLKEDNYVQEYPEGYNLTKLGEFALQVYRLAVRVGIAEQFLFINHLPSDAPFFLLQESVIREATGIVPQEPIEHIGDLIRFAHQISIIAPSVIPPLNDLLIEQIQDETTRIEIIVNDEMLEESWNHYSNEIHVCLESGTCTLWETSKDLTFGLLIVDNESMCLLVCDESIRLLGTITNERDDAVKWATEAFQKYRDASEEVFLRSTSYQSDIYAD